MDYEKKRGISGSTLKIIAILSMFIDHATAVLIEGSMYNLYREHTSEALLLYQKLYPYDRILRSIGRIAFPIFCFLLVEGFIHTRNVKKYVLRLGIFALVSEIPFDLAFHRQPFYFGYQNVFFTIFLGLLALICISWAERRYSSKLVQILAAIVFTVSFALVATALKTDYYGLGVICIVAFYLGRHTRLNQMLFGAAAFWFEFPYAQFSLIPIWFYNGSRGLKLKYFFYVFYPAHLLILYFTAKFVGIY